MSLHQTLSNSGIVLNTCIEVLSVLTLLRASTIPSTNSGYSALEFGPYTSIKHRERLNNFNLNMHTLLEDLFLNTTFQLRAYKQGCGAQCRSWAF